MYLVPIVLAASSAGITFHLTQYQETSIELNKQIEMRTEQIQYEQSFLEALISSTTFAVVRLDSNHHIIRWNSAFEDLFGYSADEIIGKHLDNLIASGELSAEATLISQSVADGNLSRKITQRKRKNGTMVDVEIVGVPISEGGKQIGVLGLYHDLSERRKIEKALRDSEMRFKSIFNESPISLWEEDFSKVKKVLDKVAEDEDVVERLKNDDDLVNQCFNLVEILDVNQATLDLYNAKSKADLIGGLPNIPTDEVLEEFRNEIIALASGESLYDCELIFHQTSGEIRNGWLRLSLPLGHKETWERVYISIVDITDRKDTEEKLRFLSFHDSLTGLYNRAYFEEELNRLESSRQFPTSIIVCDLDNLKKINDSLGHDVGDQALKAAAAILGSKVFRKEDIVARIGGDEFAIILPNVDLNENTVIRERLTDSIRKFNSSDTDDGLYRPISISSGYAVIHQDGSLYEGLKQADAEMYANKQKKKR
jgi:diguanylate cyclase (GGDEF)-like protein/PAS domain S-box-containing protein